VLIARLTAQLRCYEPEPVDETWARLRHLGARREQLITETSSQIQTDAGSARVRLAGRAGLRAAALPLAVGLTPMNWSSAAITASDRWP
jgi:hypothetical protein